MKQVVETLVSGVAEDPCTENNHATSPNKHLDGFFKHPDTRKGTILYSSMRSAISSNIGDINLSYVFMPLLRLQ